MGELNRKPDSSSTMRSADDWLREQATLDWHSAGMQSFDRWDHALSAVARLVAVSTVPMALMLGRRGVLLANPSAEGLFAEQTGVVNGRSVLDVLPAIAPFYSAVLAQVFEGRSITFRKQPVRLVSQGVSRIHWFNLDFTPIASPKGEVLGALGIANEITPLIRKMRDLSESEQRLRLALEGSGMVGVFAYDVATDVNTADSNVERMYGITPSDESEGASADRVLNAIHPEDREKMRAARARDCDRRALPMSLSRPRR